MLLGTQDSKLTVIFKTNIEVLAEYVDTSFSKDAHVAAKALRGGELPKLQDSRKIDKTASFMDQVIWKEKF